MIEQQVGDFKRIISVIPSGDGQVQIRYYIVGKKGAVDFHMHTAGKDITRAFGAKGNIYGGGVEGHHKKPIYEGQTPIKDCKIIEGDCYCDGSSLYAMERVFPDFMNEGEEAIWRHLENTYSDWFIESEDSL